MKAFIAIIAAALAAAGPAAAQDFSDSRYQDDGYMQKQTHALPCSQMVGQQIHMTCNRDGGKLTSSEENAWVGDSYGSLRSRCCQAALTVAWAGRWASAEVPNGSAVQHAYICEANRVPLFTSLDHSASAHCRAAGSCEVRPGYYWDATAEKCLPEVQY